MIIVVSWISEDERQAGEEGRPSPTLWSPSPRPGPQNGHISTKLQRQKLWIDASEVAGGNASFSYSATSLGLHRSKIVDVLGLQILDQTWNLRTRNKGDGREEGEGVQGFSQKTNKMNQQMATYVERNICILSIHYFFLHLYCRIYI